MHTLCDNKHKTPANLKNSQKSALDLDRDSQNETPPFFNRDLGPRDRLLTQKPLHVTWKQDVENGSIYSPPRTQNNANQLPSKPVSEARMCDQFKTGVTYDPNTIQKESSIHFGDGQSKQKNQNQTDDQNDTQKTYTEPKRSTKEKESKKCAKSDQKTGKTGVNKYLQKSSLKRQKQGGKRDKLEQSRDRKKKHDKYSEDDPQIVHESHYGGLSQIRGQWADTGKSEASIMQHLGGLHTSETKQLPNSTTVAFEQQIHQIGDLPKIGSFNLRGSATSSILNQIKEETLDRDGNQIEIQESLQPTQSVRVQLIKAQDTPKQTLADLSKDTPERESSLEMVLQEDLSKESKHFDKQKQQETDKQNYRYEKYQSNAQILLSDQKQKIDQDNLSKNSQIRHNDYNLTDQKPKFSASFAFGKSTSNKNFIPKTNQVPFVSQGSFMSQTCDQISINQRNKIAKVQASFSRQQVNQSSLLKSLSHQDVPSLLSGSPLKDLTKSKYSISRSLLREEKSADEVSDNILKAQSDVQTYKENLKQLKKTLCDFKDASHSLKGKLAYQNSPLPRQNSRLEKGLVENIKAVKETLQIEKIYGCGIKEDLLSQRKISKVTHERIKQRQQDQEYEYRKQKFEDLQRQKIENRLKIQSKLTEERLKEVRLSNGNKSHSQADVLKSESPKNILQKQAVISNPSDQGSNGFKSTERLENSKQRRKRSDKSFGSLIRDKDRAKLKNVLRPQEFKDNGYQNRNDKKNQIEQKDLQSAILELKASGKYKPAEFLSSERSPSASGPTFQGVLSPFDKNQNSKHYLPYMNSSGNQIQEEINEELIKQSPLQMKESHKLLLLSQNSQRERQSNLTQKSFKSRHSNDQVVIVTETKDFIRLQPSSKESAQNRKKQRHQSQLTSKSQNSHRLKVKMQEKNQKAEYVELDRQETQPFEENLLGLQSKQQTCPDINKLELSRLNSSEDKLESQSQIKLKIVADLDSTQKAQKENNEPLTAKFAAKISPRQTFLENQYELSQQNLTKTFSDLKSTQDRIEERDPTYDQTKLRIQEAKVEVNTKIVKLSIQNDQQQKQENAYLSNHHQKGKEFESSWKLEHENIGNFDQIQLQHRKRNNRCGGGFLTEVPTNGSEIRAKSSMGDERSSQQARNQTALQSNRTLSDYQNRNNCIQESQNYDKIKQSGNLVNDIANLNTTDELNHRNILSVFQAKAQTPSDMFNVDLQKQSDENSYQNNKNDQFDLLMLERSEQQGNRVATVIQKDQVIGDNVVDLTQIVKERKVPQNTACKLKLLRDIKQFQNKQKQYKNFFVINQLTNDNQYDKGYQHQQLKPKVHAKSKAQLRKLCGPRILSPQNDMLTSPTSDSLTFSPYSLKRNNLGPNQLIKGQSLEDLRQIRTMSGEWSKIQAKNQNQPLSILHKSSSNQNKLANCQTNQSMSQTYRSESQIPRKLRIQSSNVHQRVLSKNQTNQEALLAYIPKTQRTDSRFNLPDVMSEDNQTASLKLQKQQSAFVRVFDRPGIEGGLISGGSIRKNRQQNQNHQRSLQNLLSIDGQERLPNSLRENMDVYKVQGKNQANFNSQRQFYKTGNKSQRITSISHGTKRVNPNEQMIFKKKQQVSVLKLGKNKSQMCLLLNQKESTDPQKSTLLEKTPKDVKSPLSVNKDASSQGGVKVMKVLVDEGTLTSQLSIPPLSPKETNLQKQHLIDMKQLKKIHDELSRPSQNPDQNWIQATTSNIHFSSPKVLHNPSKMVTFPSNQASHELNQNPTNSKSNHQNSKQFWQLIAGDLNTKHKHRKNAKSQNKLRSKVRGTNGFSKDKLNQRGLVASQSGCFVAATRTPYNQFKIQKAVAVQQKSKSFRKMVPVALYSGGIGSSPRNSVGIANESIPSGVNQNSVHNMVPRMEAGESDLRDEQKVGQFLMDVEGKSIGRSSQGQSEVQLQVRTNEQGSLIDFKTPLPTNEFDFNRLKETIYDDNSKSGQTQNVTTHSNQDLQSSDNFGGLPLTEHIQITAQSANQQFVHQDQSQMNTQITVKVATPKYISEVLRQDILRANSIKNTQNGSDQQFQQSSGQASNLYLKEVLTAPNKDDLSQDSVKQRDSLQDQQPIYRLTQRQMKASSIVRERKSQDSQGQNSMKNQQFASRNPQKQKKSLKSQKEKNGQQDKDSGILGLQINSIQSPFKNQFNLNNINYQSTQQLSAKDAPKIDRPSDEQKDGNTFTDRQMKDIRSFSPAFSKEQKNNLSNEIKTVVNKVQLNNYDRGIKRNHSASQSSTESQDIDGMPKISNGAPKEFTVAKNISSAVTPDPCRTDKNSIDLEAVIELESEIFGKNIAQQAQLIDMQLQGRNQGENAQIKQFKESLVDQNKGQDYLNFVGQTRTSFIATEDGSKSQMTFAGKIKTSLQNVQPRQKMQMQQITDTNNVDQTLNFKADNQMEQIVKENEFQMEMREGQIATFVNSQDDDFNKITSKFISQDKQDKVSKNQVLKQVGVVSETNSGENEISRQSSSVQTRKVQKDHKTVSRHGMSSTTFELQKPQELSVEIEQRTATYYNQNTSKESSETSSMLYIPADRLRHIKDKVLNASSKLLQLLERKKQEDQEALIEEQFNDPVAQARMIQEHMHDGFQSSSRRVTPIIETTQERNLKVLCDKMTTPALLREASSAAGVSEKDLLILKQSYQSEVGQLQNAQNELREVYYTEERAVENPILAELITKKERNSYQPQKLSKPPLSKRMQLNSAQQIANKQVRRTEYPSMNQKVLRLQKSSSQRDVRYQSAGQNSTKLKKEIVSIGGRSGIPLATLVKQMSKGHKSNRKMSIFDEQNNQRSRKSTTSAVYGITSNCDQILQINGIKKQQSAEIIKTEEQRMKNNSKN